MKPMTGDTERALAAIRPIAEILGIEVSADFHFLYCDGQPIGIVCNSAYATVKEFIGYAMLWLADHEYRFDTACGSELREAVQRYWVDRENAKLIVGLSEVEGAQTWVKS